MRNHGPLIDGCSVKNEPRQIDDKDEPGNYRTQVREGVLLRIGMRGEPISNRDQLVGSWDVAADTSFGQRPPEPAFIYHLRADGTCLVKTISAEKTHENSGNWRLNDDGTFSLLLTCPPDPSIPGLEHGAIDETRLFLLGLPDGRRALWNGDGSLLLVLSAGCSR